MADKANKPPKGDASKKRKKFAGFEEELGIIDAAEALLKQASVDPTTCQPLAESLLREYKGLLARSAKVTRIGDSTQKRLIRAQEAQRKAEQKFRSIYEKTFEGIYQVSPKGSFLEVNPAFLRIFGYSSVEALRNLTQNNCRNLYAEFGRLDELFRMVQHDDALIHVESQVCRLDGSIFWISQNMHPVYDESGQLRFYEGSLVDITAKMQAESAMRQAIHAEREANEAKSRFMANMTHDLRTPLNGILGYAQILRREEDLSDRALHGLRVIHSSAEHLLALINELLDLSRIEARKMELHKADFAVEPFLRLTGSQFSERASQKGIRFRTQIEAGMPEMWYGDEQKIRQIIYNLLGNAIKFTEKGMVTFRVKRLADTQYRFDIQDSGTGIEADDIERVFQPFEQAGDRLSRSEGTGLGLAICRSLVELMQGDIGVESEPGKGSLFYFTLNLPTGNTEAQSPTQASEIIGYEGPPRDILIVDDDETHAAMLSDMLKSVGFRITHSREPESSLSKCRESPFDLVCLVVTKSDADAFEAAETMMSDCCPQVPLLAIGQENSEALRMEAFQNGFQGFVGKPIVEHEFFEWIASILDLTWRYRGEEKTVDADAPYEVPSPDVLDAFLELTRSGKVPELRNKLESLAKEQPQYAIFYDRMMALAATYNTRAIKELLESLLAPAEA